jgi:hypothetical protein
MRKLILIAAACMIAAPVAANELRATDFSSQGVYIEGPGVGVRVGRDRDRHDSYRHRGWRDREVRGNGCRTVTVRETLPDGTRVSRTRSRC